MRYLLISESAIGLQCSEPISLEIQRYDIRANIKSVSLNDYDKSDFQNWHPDIIIHVGPHNTRSNIGHLRRRGVRTCLFLIGNEVLKPRLIKRNFDMVFTTTPVDYDDLKEIVKCNYVGNPISDLIRKHNFSSDQISSTQIVALNLNRIRGNYLRAIEKLVGKLPNVEFVIPKPVERLRHLVNCSNIKVVDKSNYDVIKNTNAAITFDFISSLECVFLNCPQIHFTKKSWILGRVPTHKLNRIAQQEIIKSTHHELAIVSELQRILNDHEYCAKMLAGYQAIMDKIGMEPTFRKTGQLIADWIEEESA